MPQASGNGDRKGVWGTLSFRVALRPEPINAPGALHPFVKVGFAGQSLDVADLGTGTVGLDLPVVLRNALGFENHANPRGLGHQAVYAPPPPGRKPYSGLPHSK